MGWCSREDSPNEYQLNKWKRFLPFYLSKAIKASKKCWHTTGVVSKNDSDLVEKTLKSNQFVLNYNDFTLVRSSYEVKPKHIIELSETLNLGLESFVFIDDNPVEIAQVSSNFPSITCLQFNTDPELFYILEI